MSDGQEEKESKRGSYDAPHCSKTLWQRRCPHLKKHRNACGLRDFATVFNGRVQDDMFLHS